MRKLPSHAVFTREISTRLNGSKGSQPPPERTVSLRGSLNKPPGSKAVIHLLAHYVNTETED